MNGQPVKSTKRPLWGVKWFLFGIVLYSLMGMAFAGGCGAGAADRAKCVSGDVIRSTIKEAFEKKMTRCLFVSRAKQVQEVRRDIESLEVGSKEWNSLINERIPEAEAICRMVAFK